MTIEFNENNFSANQFTNTSSSGSAMVDFLIKKGIVKDSATGNNLLTVFALCGIGLSIYLFIFGFNVPQFNNAQSETPIVEVNQNEILDEFDF